MAIFGATAALVFADFGGPIPERIRAYARDRGRRARSCSATGTLASGSTRVERGPDAGVRHRDAVQREHRTALGGGGEHADPRVRARRPRPRAGVGGPGPDARLGGRRGPAPRSRRSRCCRRARRVRIERVAADVAERARGGAAVRADRDPTPDARRELASRTERAPQDLRPATLMPVRPSGPGVHDVARRQIVDRLASLARVMVEELRTSRTSSSAAEMVALGERRRVAWRRPRPCCAASRTPPTLADAITVCDTARADAPSSGCARRSPSDEDADAVLARVDAGFIARAGSWHALVVARTAAFLAGDVGRSPGSTTAVTDLPDPTAAVRGSGSHRFLGEYAIPTLGLVPGRAAGRGGARRPRCCSPSRSTSTTRSGSPSGTLSVLRSSALGDRADRGGRVARHRHRASRVVGGARGDRPARSAGCGSCSCSSIFLAGYLPTAVGFIAGPGRVHGVRGGVVQPGRAARLAHRAGPVRGRDDRRRRQRGGGAAVLAAAARAARGPAAGRGVDGRGRVARAAPRPR